MIFAIVIATRMIFRFACKLDRGEILECNV